MRERLFGLGQHAALVADLREIEPGAIAHLRARALLDQLREDRAGFAMQAVGEQHAAAQDLGLVAVLGDALEMLRDHQRGDRGEMMVLEEVEQRIAVVRRLDLVRGGRLGSGRAADRQRGTDNDGRGHGHTAREREGGQH